MLTFGKSCCRCLYVNKRSIRKWFIIINIWVNHRVFPNFNWNVLSFVNRCIDQAVLLSKDLGDYRDVVQLAERSCNLYQQHGSPDSGSAALDKAAKLVEQHHPEQALRLYQRAADVVLVCNFVHSLFIRGGIKCEGNVFLEYNMKRLVICSMWNNY